MSWNLYWPKECRLIIYLWFSTKHLLISLNSFISTFTLSLAYSMRYSSGVLASGKSIQKQAFSMVKPFMVHPLGILWCVHRIWLRVRVRSYMGLWMPCIVHRRIRRSIRWSCIFVHVLPRTVYHGPRYSTGDSYWYVSFTVLYGVYVECHMFSEAGKSFHISAGVCWVYVFDVFCVWVALYDVHGCMAVSFIISHGRSSMKSI